MSRSTSTFLFIVIAGAVLGAFYGVMLDQMGVRMRAHGGTLAQALVRGGARGVAVASVAGVLEIWVSTGPVGQWLRRLPFAPSLIARVLLTTGILFVALSSSHLILILIQDRQLYEDWLKYGMPRDFLFVVVTAMLIQVLMTARRLIGGRTLRNFVLGRYKRPTHEERIFVLADMVGSTAMAEKLGDESALSMIAEFFLDIDPAILRHGGEIHAYVGDEVVISWPRESAARNGRALACVAEILDIAQSRRAHYLEQYGVVPELRIGISGGHVAVGECGWEKPQVIYIGDTINRAKRLQDACRGMGTPALIDAETAAMMAIPDCLTATARGRVLLRGRTGETDVLALEPRADAA